MARTSKSHPIEVAFVDRHLLPTRARLGLTLAPGKRQASPSSGESWDRDLAADLQRLRHDYGTDLLVSLTEDHEHQMLGIADIAAATRAAGMRHLHFPIPDTSTPVDESTFQTLKRNLARELTRGLTVVVHCMGGLGRSGTVAAAVLVELGEKPHTAIERVRAVRDGAVENSEQERYVARQHGHVASGSRQDRIVGCLLGGAVGDALGAGIEFWGLDQIRSKFGPEGLDDYIEAYGRRGAITDDTQMTLFSAEGLLRAIVRRRARGIKSVVPVVRHAYLRWLTTQGLTSAAVESRRHEAHEWPDGWLIRVRDLHSQRAPGNTCLSSLLLPTDGPARNDSKGCGGIMRSAPFGLVGPAYDGDVFELAGQCSHITHGHPTEHLSSGVFAEIIHEVVGGTELRAAVDEVVKRRADLLNDEVAASIAEALRAFDAGRRGAETVEELGAGWISEEALAIGLFAALRGIADGDFRTGVLLAVNHSGDSDSTGSIAGNLMGASMGAQAIPSEWLDGLELRDVIETIGRDLWAAGEARELDWDRYPGW